MSYYIYVYIWKEASTIEKYRFFYRVLFYFLQINTTNKVSTILYISRVSRTADTQDTRRSGERRLRESNLELNKGKMHNGFEHTINHQFMKIHNMHEFFTYRSKQMATRVKTLANTTRVSKYRTAVHQTSFSMFISASAVNSKSYIQKIQKIKPELSRVF